jgi:hypothetical protein
VKARDSRWSRLGSCASSGPVSAFPQRSGFCARFGMLTALAALAYAPGAQADVSSWLFVGGGAAAVSTRGEEQVTPDFGLDVGMGSPPSGALIVGGVWRFQPHFGHGTDFGLSLRTATRGFVNGDWGLALDLGGYLRTAHTSEGALGSLVFGGPWGLVLAATASYGTHDARTVSGLLGVDLARLTVYRQTGSRWWKNPFPVNPPQ